MSAGRKSAAVLRRLGAASWLLLALTTSAHAQDVGTPPATTEPATTEPPAPESPVLEPPAPEHLAPEPPVPEPPVPEPPVPEHPVVPRVHALPAEDEISALISETELQAVTSDGPSLQIYGFADFTVSDTVRDDGEQTTVFNGDSTSFAIGNLNLYLDGHLTGGFRSLIEVRFMYMPHGNLDSSLQRQQALARDYADLGRPLRWGGVEIERAWLEYSAHNLLTIRAGQWLTPYGIWNVDHGSPAIISTMRPYVVGEQLFPERQTGIEVYGSHALDQVTLGYHLTLSNGRGTLDAYQDLDGNKALGGRLYVTLLPVGALTLGISTYFGRATEAGVSLDPLKGPVQDITSQFDELSYAIDLLWRIEQLHVQAEVIANEVSYTEAGAQRSGAGVVPSFRRWGAYGLVGYRLPWLTLMPFVSFEYNDAGAEVEVGGRYPSKITAFSVGMNVRPTPAVALKVQFSHAVLDVSEYSALVEDTVLEYLTAQAAWSF